MGNTLLPMSDFAKIVLGKRALEQLTPLMAQTPKDPPSDPSNSSAREIAHVGMFEQHLNALFIERFRQAMETFQNLIDEEASISGNHRTEAELMRDLINLLGRSVRDAWAGIRILARRKSLSNAILVAYKMPLQRSRKVKGSGRGWIQMAEDLLAGDTAAVAQGFPPMTNPDAAEVSALLEQTRQRVTAVDESALALKEVQARLRQQRLEVHKVIRILASSLRTSLVGRSASFRRDVMRQFGFLFSYENEAPEIITSQPEQEQGDHPELARIAS